MPQSNNRSSVRCIEDGEEEYGTDENGGEGIYFSNLPIAELAVTESFQQFKTELQIHSKMDHPHIVRFDRAFSFGETTYIVLELCPMGSLMDMVKKRRYLTEPETRFYMVQLVGAVKYMHARGIIHRDLVSLIISYIIL